MGLAKKILMLMFLFAGFQAKAGFLIEPYLGCESGTLTSTDLTSADTGGKTTMADVGIRLGHTLGAGFWLGLEYMAGLSGTMSYTNSALGTNPTATKSELGATLGWEYRRIRLYGEYVFTPQYVLTSNSVDTTFSGGSAFKVGFGVRLFWVTTLNAEYYSQVPTKYNTGGTSADVSAGYNSFSENGVRAVLSFPFFTK